jgi:hypothetical protein
MVKELHPISVDGILSPSLIQSPAGVISAVTPFQETGISPGSRSVSSLSETLRVASSSPPAWPDKVSIEPFNAGTLTSNASFGETLMLPV